MGRQGPIIGRLLEVPWQGMVVRDLVALAVMSEATGITHISFGCPYLDAGYAWVGSIAGFDQMLLF